MTISTLCLPAGPTVEKSTMEEIITEPVGHVMEIHPETVGRAFYSYLRGDKPNDLTEAACSDEDPDDSIEIEEESEFVKKWKELHDKGVSVDTTSMDHYEVLGLGEIRYRASPDDIRTAYKKKSLQYHPDKNKDAGAETMFKMVNKAYELLSDPVKRKAVDSSDHFDESIPKEEQAKSADFFELFNPVFDRNSRWSTRHPIPFIGKPDTPIDEVVKFYNFWFTFKSWRDFSHLNEFDLDDAQCREEKRWMERENKKLRVKRIREETARIRVLTETAYKFDPRIIKMKEEEKEKKQKEKERIEQEREESARQKKRKEMEEQQAKEDAEKAAAEEVARQKKDKEREKKARAKERTRLRKAVTGHSTWKHDAVQLEMIIAELGTLQLSELSTILEAKDDEASQKAFDHQVSQLQATQQQEKAKRDDAAKAAQAAKEKLAAANDSPWTVDELSLLSKAYSRFPGGLPNRWGQIAEFIGTRTEQEVIAKSKEMKTADTRPVVNANDFDRFKVKKSEIQKAPKKGADTAPDQRDIGENPLAKKTEGKAAASTSKVSAQHCDDNGMPLPPRTDWSLDEQKQFEKALADFPASDKERWPKISAAVGRDEKQCKRRFKDLREYFKALKEWKAAQQ
eukprot:GFYU01009082.1.p1 GENE.GFYU01009082.1~~GFYU01009082.1.p1  ORF type:complete len:626 (-),score=114.33 GFYU01009082.1:591-2468(-)